MISFTVESASEKKDSRKKPQIRPNRMKPAEHIPSEEELIAIKNKKKVEIQHVHFTNEPVESFSTT